MEMVITTAGNCKMSSNEFKEKTGRSPRDDDLDRVGCSKAGQPGHQQCGWCSEHDLPRFECGCIFLKIKGR